MLQRSTMLLPTSARDRGALWCWGHSWEQWHAPFWPSSGTCPRMLAQVSPRPAPQPPAVCRLAGLCPVHCSESALFLPGLFSCMEATLRKQQASLTLLVGTNVRQNPTVLQVCSI